MAKRGDLFWVANAAFSSVGQRKKRSGHRPRLLGLLAGMLCSVAACSAPDDDASTVDNPVLTGVAKAALHSEPASRTIAMPSEQHKNIGYLTTSNGWGTVSFDVAFDDAPYDLGAMNDPYGSGSGWGQHFFYGGRGESACP